MGKIASASTIYATAYLTETGRNYLFNNNNIRFDSNGNDLFAIQTFCLSDPDSNYNTANRLQSGDVPDISGKSEGCIKSTDYKGMSCYVLWQVDSTISSNPTYMTDGVFDSTTNSYVTGVNADGYPNIDFPSGV